NSIAGAIFIQTADPAYRFEGRVRAIAGESARRQLSAIISGPLIGDQLAFRVAGDLYRSHAANSSTGPAEARNSTTTASALRLGRHGFPPLCREGLRADAHPRARPVAGVGAGLETIG